MKSIKKIYNENGMGYIGKYIPKNEYDLATRWIKLDFMVKDLKAILNKLDDDIQIVIRDEKNDWWLNIESLELPDEDDGSYTLTFNPKDNFDNRQF